ncbi:hypothetical protein HMN09_00848200 [Mycena chlorophos]|uniref:Uncharacterized protein n=1 Tax=Mycena chlorophos TaxID=658473 RepID=A0A8H6SR03_MYCCL|nr:hypothetical protein HMN09_00848200 [Mycena chlorophos]
MTGTVPALVGGFALRQFDLVPAALFSSAYGIVALLLTWRMWDRRWRSITLFEVVSLASERMVSMALRAICAANPSFESPGLTKYLQLTLALGYITFAFTLSKLLRAFLVGTTHPPYTQSEIPLSGLEVDDPRRRAQYRNINTLQLLPYFAGLILAIAETRHSYTDPDTSTNRAERIAAATAALVLLLSEAVEVVRFCRRPRMMKKEAKAVLWLGVLTALLLCPALYRIIILVPPSKIQTPNVEALTHAALNTAGDKAEFYIFHILPEWLGAVVMASVNTREVCSTGAWGDWRSKDPDPRKQEDEGAEKNGAWWQPWWLSWLWRRSEGKNRNPRDFEMVGSLGVLLLAVLLSFHVSSSPSTYSLTSSPLPTHVPTDEELDLGHPLFLEVREIERGLVQHQVGRWAKGFRRRYVYFPWEAWGTGWNNVFQEQLLNTHLAYLADRGYVFVDYIARDHPPFPDTLGNGTRHHLHIPMNAFTSGPTGGGSWGHTQDNSTRPRGVSHAWWNRVCAGREVEISTPRVNEEFGIGDATSGMERMQRWAEKLRGMQEECVKVVDGSPFDYPFMISTKPASIWPSFGNSPTLTAFAWSALVTRALIRNHALFLPPAEAIPGYLEAVLSWRLRFSPRPRPSLGSITDPFPLSSIRPLSILEPPISGLLGLHIRRGDYETHCRNLAEWKTPYNTWDYLGAPELHEHPEEIEEPYPHLPDFHSPTADNAAESINTHCFPAIPTILSKIQSLSSESTGFTPTQIYIATNAAPSFLSHLTSALSDALSIPPGRITSSFDMAKGLTREEKAVDQAVDMAVLVQSEMFVGNGWSSLTSNVVGMRLAGGRAVETSRFW